MAKFTGTPGDDNVAANFVPPFNGFIGGTLDELLDDVGDKFNGLAGRDLVFAGPGDDILDGGAGGDFLHGGLGDDRLIGGLGNDFMRGDGGDDVYDVDSGQFEIPADRDLTQELPGGGHDTVRSTIDWILDANVEDLVLLNTVAKGTGNSENNEIEGNSAANVLSGLDGNDVLVGEAGDDNIDGGAGNDRLLGGAGNDTMTGGPGDDFYVVDRQSHEDRVIENPDGGTDTVHASASYALLTEVENLTLIGKAAIDGIGNPLDNRMEGNSAANTIGGIAGNDVLSGAAGNDFLLGDTGNDILNGDGGDDRLLGNEGNDELNGGRGRDILEGGSGEDTFSFDSLLFRFGSANGNLDTIRDFSSRDDILAVSASAFGGGLVADEFLVPGRSFIANGNPAPTTDIGTFLYDTDSGALYWDINGTDPGGQVQVAQLDGAPRIDPGHFHIF